MESIFAMFPTVGAIAVICFLVGQTVKTTSIPTKFVPVIVAIVGAVLGLVGHFIGVLELANVGIFDAVATGIVSGLVSSGAFSLVKNITGAYPENDYAKSEQAED